MTITCYKKLPVCNIDYLLITTQVTSCLQHRLPTVYNIRSRNLEWPSATIGSRLTTQCLGHKGFLMGQQIDSEVTRICFNCERFPGLHCRFFRSRLMKSQQGNRANHHSSNKFHWHCNDELLEWGGGGEEGMINVLRLNAKNLGGGM